MPTIALKLNSMINDVQVPGFRLSYVSSPKDIKFICEHRLIGRECLERRKWLKEQIALLEQSFAASTQNELWASYCTTDAGVVSFLIDAERGTFCTGPFP